MNENWNRVPVASTCRNRVRSVNHQDNVGCRVQLKAESTASICVGHVQSLKRNRMSTAVYCDGFHRSGPCQCIIPRIGRFRCSANGIAGAGNDNVTVCDIQRNIALRRPRRRGQ